MANDVFANGREVACKKADGKSICAFPDVCMTPPENPATPPGVPVPYPNTGLAKDTTKGSKNVKVSGEEVMLKNKSYFKKSIGDEAGSAAKKGVVTSVNRGKVYFISWSMDVKFEGENVVRHLDLTTHNHGSPVSNTAPWTYADRMEMAEGIKDCDEAKKKAKKACGGDLSKKAKCPSNAAIKKAEAFRQQAKDRWGENSNAYQIRNAIVTQEYENFAKEVQKDDCQKALRCFLSPYKPSRCCPGQTPHHVIDAASFLKGPDFPGQPRNKQPKKVGWQKYDVDKAPCVCVEGRNQTTATHGEMHVRTGVVAWEKMDANGQWTRKQATTAGVNAVTKTCPNTKSCEKCLKKQLDKYHDSARSTTDGKDKPINANLEWKADLKYTNKACREMGVPEFVSL